MSDTFFFVLVIAACAYFLWQIHDIDKNMRKVIQAIAKQQEQTNTLHKALDLNMESIGHLAKRQRGFEARMQVVEAKPYALEVFDPDACQPVVNDPQ